MTIVKCLIDHATFLVHTKWETRGKAMNINVPVCFECCTTCDACSIAFKLLLAAASSVKCYTTVNDVWTRLTRTQLAICVLLHCWGLLASISCVLVSPFYQDAMYMHAVCLELAHLVLIDLMGTVATWTTGQKNVRQHSHRPGAWVLIPTDSSGIIY